MKIGEPSLTSFGTQVVLQVRIDSKLESKRRILPGDREWPRFNAMATKVAELKEVEGTFFCADVNPFLGGLGEIQLSWTNGAVFVSPSGEISTKHPEPDKRVIDLFYD